MDEEKLLCPSFPGLAMEVQDLLESQLGLNALKQ